MVKWVVVLRSASPMGSRRAEVLRGRCCVVLGTVWDRIDQEMQLDIVVSRNKERLLDCQRRDQQTEYFHWQVWVVGSGTPKCVSKYGLQGTHSSDAGAK